MCKKNPSITICLVCGQPHSGKGDVCHNCKVVLDNLLLTYGEQEPENQDEKIQRAGRVHLCRRKAAVKNGTANLHDKEVKATANAEARKQRKNRVTERALRLGDTRYRNRRTFAATQELIEALNADFSAYVFDEDILTVFTDCDTDFNVNVNNNPQPTLGDIFVAIDPRFALFLQMQENSDEPVEVIGGIEPRPDVTGLRAYASLGAYARQQASYAD